ncbi:MAG TPA: asparaginase [Burkholderiaceae bacterium]|nr:asparaginase [Burkholderiaceae bacterium]
MQSSSEAALARVVVLGTGGTIAGTSASAGDNVGYTAAQRGVAQLVGAVPALAQVVLETEQVAQLDSKDMGYAVWHRLAQRIAHHLARPEVTGVVVTHGTDTLEETAWFLQRVLAPAKPVVLTAAMRPTTALHSDGPQNLVDAIGIAREPGARGVVAALAGTLHAARDVRKLHPYRIDAFGSGDAGPLARIEEGRLRQLREWPAADDGLGVESLPKEAGDWPWVEIVTSGVQADGAAVRALLAAGVRGLVVATTGNGSVHADLEAALHAAQQQGVAVLRATRCLDGTIIEAAPAQPGALPSAGDLTPVKARVELMLRLLRPRSA